MTGEELYEIHRKANARSDTFYTLMNWMKLAESERQAWERTAAVLKFPLTVGLKSDGTKLQFAEAPEKMRLKPVIAAIPHGTDEPFVRVYVDDYRS